MLRLTKLRISFQQIAKQHYSARYANVQALVWNLLNLLAARQYNNDGNSAEILGK